MALKYRRYNDRHDEVLRTITTYLKEEISEDFTVVADLDDHQSYLSPLNYIAVSDLRPDVVMFSQLQKAAFIFELTIFSEVTYAAAQERKTAKYMELVSEVEKKGFNTELITLEVGSRGLVRVDGFKRLRDSVCGDKQRWKQLLQDITITAIKGSYKIWTSRNHPTLLDIHFSTLHE